MNTIIYLKRYQYNGLYHYAKLLPDRSPPLCETINFLNPVPLIEHREYDLAALTDQLDYDTLFTTWEWIKEDEFRRAYNRATVSDFQIYIDGKTL